MQTITPIPSGYSGNTRSSEEDVLSIYFVPGIVLDTMDSEVPDCRRLGEMFTSLGLHMK